MFMQTGTIDRSNNLALERAHCAGLGFSQPPPRH